MDAQPGQGKPDSGSRQSGRQGREEAWRRRRREGLGGGKGRQAAGRSDRARRQGAGQVEEVRRQAGRGRPSGGWQDARRYERRGRRGESARRPTRQRTIQRGPNAAGEAREAGFSSRQHAATGGVPQEGGQGRTEETQDVSGGVREVPPRLCRAGEAKPKAEPDAPEDVAAPRGSGTLPSIAGPRRTGSGKTDDVRSQGRPQPPPGYREPYARLHSPAGRNASEELMILDC